MRDIADINGLYAITDTALQPSARLPSAVAAAVRGGARVIQYRDKHSDDQHRLEQAHALADICHRAGALFIVNDDISLAAACQADGVHLGRGDGDVAAARRRLGVEAVVGVSCYNELERARTAQAVGASYVAFGSVFVSSVKPWAPRSPLSLFTAARECLDVPVVAIGGIDADNATQVIAAGADAVAVISGVFAATDVAAAARRLTACFEF